MYKQELEQKCTTLLMGREENLACASELKYTEKNRIGQARHDISARIQVLKKISPIYW